jgi:hypothetical protein
MRRCRQVLVRYCVPTAAVTLAVSVTFGQVGPPAGDDSVRVRGSPERDRDRLFLGEDASTIEAVAWELDAIPPSLVSPARYAKEEDSAFRRDAEGEWDEPPGGRRKGEKSVSCEMRFLRTSGSSATPADSLLLGDPMVSVFRLKMTPFQGFNGHLVLGKQSGERVRDASIFGSVSYSRGVLKQIILGDYRFRAGSGLVLSGTVTNYGEGATRGSHTGGSLRPYFGTGLTGFLRGGALELASRIGGGTAAMTVLVSRRSLAAAVQNDGRVSAIDWSGYQRTERELDRQGQLEESLVGVHASWQAFSRSVLGVTWYRSAFSRTIMPRRGLGFRGERAEFAGLEGSVVLRSATVRTEIARDSYGHCSMVTGVKATPAEKMSVAVTARWYAPGFSNPHASASGKHATGENERGLLIGFTTSPVPGLDIEGSLDVYAFPVATSTDPLPSSGREVGLRCTYRSERGIAIATRARITRTSDLRIVSVAGAFPGRREVGRERLSVSNVVQLPAFSGMRVLCRSTIVSVRSEYGLPGSRGYAISLAGTYEDRMLRGQWSFGLFSANRYEAATVDIEPDLGRPATAVVCYGSGSRVSLWFSCAVSGWLEVSGKAGAIFYRWKPIDGRPVEAPPASSTLGISCRMSI